MIELEEKQEHSVNPPHCPICNGKATELPQERVSLFACDSCDFDFVRPLDQFIDFEPVQLFELFPQSRE